MTKGKKKKKVQKYQEERKKTPVLKCVTPLDTGLGLIVMCRNGIGRDEDNKRRESLSRNCRTVPFVEQNHRVREINYIFLYLSHTLKTNKQKTSFSFKDMTFFLLFVLNSSVPN